MKQNLYSNRWNEIESDETRPRYIRNIVLTTYEQFRNSVFQQEPGFVRHLVDSLYAGDYWVIKNCFAVEWVEKMKKDLFAWGQQTPSEFFKMLEGVKDYHRIIDKDVSKNYAVEAIKHSYYFFPWNQDQFNLFSPIYERWSMFKFLGGYRSDEYCKNTPKDGVVDRIQIVHYPAGTGGLETHTDPLQNQRVIISGILAKRGVHYKTGGVYAVNDKNEHVELEPLLDVGDMYMGYPSVLHGVQTVDADLELDWNNPRGRWFMGLYSNDTDYKKDRITSVSVKNIPGVQATPPTN